jgi:hypothetical protein
MGGVRKVITTNIGTAYTLTLNIDMGTAEGLYIMPRTTNGGNIYTGTNLAQVYVTSSGTYTVNFTATTGTTQLLVEKAGSVEKYFYIDNVKVEQSTPTLNSYPIADVVSAQHYYPYHSTMQTWEADGKEYTFGGANGQEKDFEIFKGAYTAEFWEYDSRLGKRWNIDPVVKHHESPYVTFAGNPIWLIDPLGADSEEVNGVWKWKLEANEDYGSVETKTGVKAVMLRAFTQIPDKQLKAGQYIELNSPEYSAEEGHNKINIVDEEKVLGYITIRQYLPTNDQYEAGVRMEFEYTNLTSGLTNFNWSQSFYSNFNSRENANCYPCADGFGGGVYNSGRESEKKYRHILNDHPQRSFGVMKSAYWYGESSVVGTNKSGAYKPLLTLGWGFTMRDGINGKNFSIPNSQKTFPIKIVDPSSGHLRLIRKRL